VHASAVLAAAEVGTLSDVHGMPDGGERGWQSRWHVCSARDLLLDLPMPAKLMQARLNVMREVNSSWTATYCEERLVCSCSAAASVPFSARISPTRWLLVDALTLAAGPRLACRALLVAKTQVRAAVRMNDGDDAQGLHHLRGVRPPGRAHLIATMHAVGAGGAPPSSMQDAASERRTDDADAPAAAERVQLWRKDVSGGQRYAPHGGGSGTP